MTISSVKRYLSSNIGVHKKLAYSFVALSLTLLFLGLFTIFSNHQIYAQSAEELDKKYSEIQNQINKLQQQLDQTRSQEKTLKSQLSVIDNQSKITELKIEETKNRIEKLKREIVDLSGRIDRLSVTVDNITNVLLSRIIKTYKYGSMSPLDLLFSSNGFSELIERLKYLQVAQANDKKVLYQLQATKSTYNDQKSDKQQKQSEAEQLNKELEGYQAQLDQQRKDKQYLLTITKNDETRYQGLITQLRADADSIRRALGGSGVKLGPVKRGDIIAVVGNTGCSTGAHLHYEVMVNAHVENNALIGKENKVDPKPYIDSGQFQKPLDNYNGQRCGSTCQPGNISTLFMERYLLGVHTGLDIVDYAGTPIKASDDGIAYEFHDSTPCYLTDTVGKGIVLSHDKGGYVTLYWHIP